MVIESSLAKQASAFTDSLNVKPAPSVERTPDETGQDIKTPAQGDRITLSKEAKALAATGKGGQTAQTSDESSEEDMIIKKLKERIKQLQEDIKELEQSNLPQKEKTKQLQAKQSELMELQEQLSKAMEAKIKAMGGSVGGGTRAGGFGNSAMSF